MAGRIPQSFVDELLARTDIVEVVDSRVRLKKAGKNYSACCPFHSEKTPSFTVSSQKQFYYCFGCGASGNAIGFVIEYDGVSFPEAVENLANQVGLEVPRSEAQIEASKAVEDERQRCYRVLEQASEFYTRQLRSHPNKEEAVRYFKQRGLTGQIAKAYDLGYAPPGWDNLIQRFSDNDEPLADDIQQTLIDSGLVIQNDQGRVYDRFRGRVIFPIRDVRGRVLGFGARTLTEEKPKYINSPETPVFHKGSELYGLYECRRNREPLKRVLVTEGYMDVVALAQHGIHYAVATLGTATSAQHLQRLFKFVSEIYFCFDGDDAGRRAAQKAAEQALPFMEDGRQIRFLFLPENEDPDSLVRQEGKEAFEARMERQSLSLGDYLFRVNAEQVNEHSMEGKARLGHLMLPDIEQLPEGIFKRLMLEKLADRIGVGIDALKQQAETLVDTKKATSYEPIKRQSDDQDSAAKGEPSASSLPDASEKTAQTSGALSLEWEVSDRIELAMINLLMHPQLVKQLNKDEIERFSAHRPELILLRTLYEGVERYHLQSADEVYGFFLARLPHHEASVRRWMNQRHKPDKHGLVPTQKPESVLLQELEEVLSHYRKLSLEDELADLFEKVHLGSQLSHEEQQRFNKLLSELKG